MKIRITVSSFVLEAELRENNTAAAVFKALPHESIAYRWGDEIYFDLPVRGAAEDLKQEMEVGDLGYWAEGEALAIFFGPTPASGSDQPVAAVPVTYLGRIDGDLSRLGEVRSGTVIFLETC